jgi:hypothetical protein
MAMSNSRNAGAAAGGGAIYGLGIFGALVYFWHLFLLTLPGVAEASL